MSMYRFPTEIQSMDRVINLRDLKTKLITQSLSSGFQVRRGSMKNVSFFQYHGKYVIAKCLYRNKECPWRLTYTKKVYKSYESSPLEIWEQTGDYVLTMKYTHLFHNHMPFNQSIPLERFPSYYAALWASLNRLQFPTKKIFQYSNDYKNLFHVPGSIARIKSKQVDMYKDNMSFSKWKKQIKSKMNVDILDFPTQSVTIPDIVILNARKSYQICAWHGQVIGIKRIDPKIHEVSQNYQGFKGLIFYQFIPGWKRVSYMFAIYSEGNQKIVIEDFNDIFRLSDPHFSTQKVWPKTRKAKINFNIYKIIRVFLRIIGTRVRTFVIDFDEIMIDTVNYTLRKVNQEKTHSYKLNWIVDPTFYFADITHSRDNYCGKIIRSLMQTCSEYQYLQLYKKYWDMYIKSEQSLLKDIVEQFHLHYKYLLPFTREEPIYTGGFFEHFASKLINLELILEKMEEKRTMIKLLDTCIKYMVQEVKDYEHRPKLIENIYYEKVYPFTYLKEARCNMMKKGFFLLVRESLQVNTINFVSPGDTTEEVREKNKEIQLIQNQINQRFKSQYPTIKELDVKQRQSQLDRSSWKNSTENIYYLEERSKVYKQIQGQQSSICLSDSISIFNKQKDEQNNERLYFDERFRKYEEKYPLQPATLIKTTTPLPPYLEIQDKGQFYVCKLEVHSKEWYQQYSKKQHASYRVDSSYYRFQYHCSCGFRQIKGIPCRHILKICLKHDLAVQRYIQSYWKFKQSKSQWHTTKYMMLGAPVPSVGRPKLSHRRNRKRYSPGINLVEGYYFEGCQINS